jgi:hypothetical protein
MLRLLGAVLVVGMGLSGCVFYLNPLCTDQISNGDETDIDCGGSCGRCDIGASCHTNADCEDSTCVGGTCTPLPCVNGVRDGAETDVDCGGGTCRKCAGDRQCAVADDCFSGTCSAAGTCTSLATVSFADAVAYPSGDKTYALFSGDLDGDGDLDLVAANEQESTISVFLNDGAGGFQRVGAPVPGGNYPTGGAIADLNGDGLPDVVTADYHGNAVTVLFNSGAGVLGGKATYPTVDGAETSNLAVGDLDGDGNLDVIATNPQRASISVFRGSATGTLAPAVDLPVGIEGGSEPYSAAIGDFDLDGHADVAIADVRTHTLIVRLGNGNATFAAEVPYAEGGTPPYIVITRDVDLDGVLDLVCANRGSDSVSVLLGRGDGTFRKALVSSTGPMTGPYSVAVADFNVDGVPDLATANFMGNDASVLLGIGDGRFEPPINSGPTGDFCYGVVAADLSGDGVPDLATANAAVDNITVKLSTAH